MENGCRLLGCTRCCRNINIFLTEAEAQILRDGGSSLVSINRLDLFARVRKMYRIVGPCGNLTSEGMCGVYGKKDRPSVCNEFEQNGPGCKKLLGV